MCFTNLLKYKLTESCRNSKELEETVRNVVFNDLFDDGHIGWRRRVRKPLIVCPLEGPYDVFVD